MALSDAPLDAPPRPVYHRRGCGVGQFARRLPERERRALTVMLETWPPQAISDWLANDADYHVEISAQTIRRHRKGQCSCGTL